MERLMLTAAALALLTTTAPAADQAATSEWVHTLIIYDEYCEPLPGIKAAAIKALGPIPREVNNAAMDRAWAFYHSAGPEHFCEETQAKMKANHKWLFEAR